VKRFWRGFWLIFVASVVAAYYVLCVPKIGHATEAEIEAALPASLKVVDPPELAGEDRYRRLAAIAKRVDLSDFDKDRGSYSSYPDPQKAALAVAKNEGLLARVEPLLAEGGLRVPARSFDKPNVENYKLKQLGRVIGLSIVATSTQKRCLQQSLLGLRYANALATAGGTVDDAMTAATTLRFVLISIYRAEMLTDFSPEGRSMVREAIASFPEAHFADAIRRDFQGFKRPFLVDPDHAFKSALGKDSGWPIGTFNPVATAQLMGRICEAAMRDVERPLDQQSGEAQRLADEAMRWLPGDLGRYNVGERCVMNSQSNTMGRTLAAANSFDGLAEFVATRKATIALLEAFLILRSGGEPNLPDPFGKGSLRIDPKRRIVWSVGRDGKDTGGQIEEPGSTSAPDYGFLY
jgi:hypothetical protein